MKLNDILIPVIVGLGLVAMTSCSDDNDSNPTLHQPTSFTLNTPAMSELTIDLAESKDSVVLTWSQPNYGGMPLATTYYIQYSADGQFSSTTDDDGNVTLNYVQEDEPLHTCRGAVAAEDLNRNLMHLLNVTSAAQVPAVQEVYFRVTAQTASTDLIYSNAVKQLVAPYFRALVAADPIIWYLTGSCIGDGSWASTVPTGCMPLYLSQDNTYDEVSGTGEITWAGYLTTGGFKFRGSPDDNWAVQIGQGGSFGEYVLNDGGSGNITVPTDGCYTVTLDTKTNIPVIASYEGTVRVFDGIALSGSFNGWGDTELSPITTVCENHDWYISIDLTAGTEVKFKQTGSWDFNWGGEFTSLSNGYYGNGVGNGPNLYIAEDGTYDIFFNDLTGLFRFVRQ